MTEKSCLVSLRNACAKLSWKARSMGEGQKAACVPAFNEAILLAAKPVNTKMTNCSDIADLLGQAGEALGRAQQCLEAGGGKATKAPTIADRLTIDPSAKKRKKGKYSMWLYFDCDDDAPGIVTTHTSKALAEKAARRELQDNPEACAEVH